MLRSSKLTFISFFLICAHIIISLILARPVYADTTINFDSYPSGTRIDEQYAALGVYFLNDYDYQPDMLIYRSSPQITANANAPSSPNVLVNDFFDIEIGSSHNVPMVIWFDEPMASVSMWLGTPDSTYCTPQAIIRAHDCNGSLLQEKSSVVTGFFNNYVEFEDLIGRIQRVVINYGDTGCPEAIDNLRFELGSGECEDVISPQVNITSHAENSVVNTAIQIIEGTISEPGILKSLKINGVSAKFYMAFGLYRFRVKVALQDGANTITVLAEDAAGLKGSDQVTMTLGVPSSVSLGQFHLTQRGVMLNQPCDVDSPFVAGKTAIVRIFLDVKTADGLHTYVSPIEMKLWRKSPSGDELVDVFWGKTYSPFLSMFNSPYSMTAIHFWIDGHYLEPAGEYKFEFQPYVGLTPVDDPLVANCNGEYFEFSDTNPMKLFILPVEAGVFSSVHEGSDHVRNYFAQLDAFARTYPVKDGFYPYSGGGIHYTEGSPITLCDGTEKMKQTFPDLCKGTGFEWKWIEKHGDLTRADCIGVTDLGNPDICGGGTDTSNRTIGGEIQSNATFPFPYNKDLGIYRAGAHPGWEGAKYTCPLDENRDGIIDTNDLLTHAAEFFDEDGSPQPQWTTDFSEYDQGETFRFFADEDGDHCNDRKVEPQAPIRILWRNQKDLLNGTHHADAMNKHNELTKGTNNDMEYASLWVPLDLIAPEAFGSIGPGQGNSPGKTSWIKLRYASAVPHELGHNVAGFDDLYIDPDPDDLLTKENAWTVYVKYDSYPPEDIFAVMSFDRDPERVVFIKDNYKTLFDKLKVVPDPDSVTQASTAEQLEQKFSVSGKIYPAEQVVNARTSLTSNLETTPSSPTSPYELVFGFGTTPLLSHPFEVSGNIPPPEGYDTWPLDFINFHVTSPFPPQAEWVELRFDNEPLERWDRSTNPPVVQMQTPNGGESYGANDEVTIRWLSSDPDGDQLRHTIYYSPDNGQDWMVLATGLSGQEYNWKLGDSPGSSGSNGLVRVVASDGFNTGEDETGTPFEVGGKPPLVTILNPKPGQVFLQCEHLHLKAAVRDPENRLDQTLWTIDGTLILGGTSVEVKPQAPGIHQIVITATDEDGFSANDTVEIFVLADSDCDSMSDIFEEQHGLDPGFVKDAALDGDDDGLMNFDEARYGTNPNKADSDGDGYSDKEEIESGSDPNDDNSTPNNPPVANAGPDQTVELTSFAGADVALDGSGSFDPDGDSFIYKWTWDSMIAYGENPIVTLPPGLTTVTLTVYDGKLNDSDTVNITVADTTPPEVSIITPDADDALQDGAKFTAIANDISGVDAVYFYLREPGGGNGVPIGYENLTATWNAGTGRWEYNFDTTVLDDGYYVLLAKAVDSHGNEGWSAMVPFSIRNWAVLELLPASKEFRAGRTMPVKFSLRIVEAVDPAMPFVYNEELEIQIYKSSDPGNILQTSLFGDTSTDYRINSLDEHYITNFKTEKKPAEYTVEVWRTSKNFLIDSFTFETLRK